MKAPYEIFIPAVAAENYAESGCYQNAVHYVIADCVRELTDEECDALAFRMYGQHSYFASSGQSVDSINAAELDFHRKAIRAWFAKIQGGV